MPPVSSGVTRGLIQGKTELKGSTGHCRGPTSQHSEKNLRIECDYGCSRVYFKTLNNQKILRKTQISNNLLKTKRIPKWNISLWSGRCLNVACQVGRFSPLPPVSYATACVTLTSHTSGWCVTVCHSSNNIFVPLQSCIPVTTRGLLWAKPPKQNFKAPQIEITSTTNREFLSKIKLPKVKTLIEDFLTTVLQSSMKDRIKLVIDLKSTWMTDRIRYFPVVQKQNFTNILHPRQCGKDSCHPPLKQQLPIISFLTQWIS